MNCARSEIDEVCWVLTTGEAGMRSQALGLAEAVGLPIVEKRIAPLGKRLDVHRRILLKLLLRSESTRDGLLPPWPRLAIACGGGSVDPTLRVKQFSGGRTLAVYIQNPQSRLAKFDLVVAMPHDCISGRNVMEVGTALHRVTTPKLAAGQDRWRDRLVPGARKILGVLVGGDVRIGRDKSEGPRLTEAVTRRLIVVLNSAHAAHGMSAAITPSRRTSVATKQAIAQAISLDAFGTMWDGDGENPYLGILGLAERLIVTGESISMVSEALATGRPVHVLPLEGSGARQDAFLKRIGRQGLISLIDGDDLDWNFAGCPPINSTTEAAARIRAMLNV